MQPRDTLILTRREVKQVLSMELALTAVESAFAQHGRDEVRMPPKVYLDLPEFEGDFRAMPAYLPALETVGLKWVCSHAANPAKGLPAVLAVYVLNDPRTAEPLAIMDGTELTLQRTGAAGGVAAKYLSRENSSVAALVGAGSQSHAQLEALLTVRPIRQVRAFDPRPEAVAALAEAFQGRVEVEAAPSVELCVRDADIVVTTTPCHTPVVERDWIRPGTHLTAIGADAPGKQELDARILVDAEVFIDDPAQAFHSGEVNVPLSLRVFSREHVRGTLGQVVAGRIPGRRSDEQLTVFDSTGLAVQDAATARAVYERALEVDLGISLPLVAA